MKKFKEGNILGYIMKDVVDAYLYGKIVMLLLAVMAVFLLIVFTINQDFPRTVSVAGGLFLASGGLVVLSRGRIAGALMLGIIGVILIIVAGRL